MLSGQLALLTVKNREDQYGVRKEFRVRGLENLNQLVKFFQEHPFQTATKRRSFETFSRVIEMMNKGEHLTKDGLDKIAMLVSKMNRKPNLKYLESSETIRQTPTGRKQVKIQSDPHGDMRRLLETVARLFSIRGHKSNRCERNTLPLNWRLA